MRKEDQKILQARAKMISGREIGNESQEEMLEVVEFMLIPEKYAIESSFVTEVLPLRNLTFIPGTPAFVVGIMNVRGKIISVINLKTFFNLKEKGISALNRVLILDHGKMELGILTDDILGTRQMEISSLSKTPITLHGTGADYIHGISRKGTILLNARAILTGESIIVNQK